jgi:hypothetical protein
LTDGKVLVVGGWTGVQPNNVVIPDAEYFDPVTSMWVAVGQMSTPRSSFIVTLLETGQVAVAGGNDGVGELKTV